MKCCKANFEMLCGMVFISQKNTEHYYPNSAKHIVVQLVEGIAGYIPQWLGKALLEKIMI